MKKLLALAMPMLTLCATLGTICLIFISGEPFHALAVGGKPFQFTHGVIVPLIFSPVSPCSQSDLGPTQESSKEHYRELTIKKPNCEKLSWDVEKALPAAANKNCAFLLHNPGVNRNIAANLQFFDRTNNRIQIVNQFLGGKGITLISDQIKHIALVKADLSGLKANEVLDVAILWVDCDSGDLTLLQARGFANPPV